MNKWLNTLRSVTGLVLMTFVTLHFINHGLGLISISAMDAMRELVSPIWRNPVGTTVLLGSLLLHYILALRVLYLRRTLKMPLWQAAQLCLGLTIPLLLSSHLVGAGLAADVIGFEMTYRKAVTAIWLQSRLTVQQMIAILVVWGHLMIGLHFWLRIKPWYPTWLPVFYPLMVLIPVLALMGFYRAGLNSESWNTDERILAQIFAEPRAAPEETREMLAGLEAKLLWLFTALPALVLAMRALRKLREKKQKKFFVRHSSGKNLQAAVGVTLLEAIRVAGIPHASVCGGRARCSTCRVRVTDGLDALDPPGDLELSTLRRIKAAPNVRLACQIRPTQDISIAPLLPPNVSLSKARRPGGVQGQEKEVTAMFVDLRGSTAMAEQKLPYDVVFVLNQFFAEMAESLAETRGHYAQFAGDGLMALYGLETGLEQGARDALNGAAVMFDRLAQLNQTLAQEIPEGLKIGIGIHSGEAIVGTMGPPASPILSAIGDSINIAARLESKTKEYQCNLVISDTTAKAADIDLSDFPVKHAEVRGRGGSVKVYALQHPNEIPGRTLQSPWVIGSELDAAPEN